MPNKEIKLKLTLNSIGEYDGGAEALLNDIKNAGVVIHRDDEGFLMTSDCVGKYSAYTESVSNLNELDHLVVYDVNDNEIGRLKIDFLELDDSLYNIPEGSTFEETELIIGFLEPETYTILFTNLTHPEFDIALPDSMTVVEGESVTLPSVSGEYEDAEYTYTPESWNIGAFESEITPTEDMTANLVWHSEAKIIEHTITFTNTTHPEFAVELPESMTVSDGESVSLPSVSGSFEDSGYEYTPLEWSIGAFGESFTPTEDVTANLLWKAEEIKPALPEVSSRNDFGDYNWLYVNTNLSYKTIQPNANEQLVFSISKSPAPYDSSKSYGVMIMQQYENGASGDSTLFSIINYSDTIGVKNISSNAVDAYAFRIAICSSSQAIIIVVYSSNNTAYNAFKYTLDGVDYYYVLDNIQTDWTDDLSSIGYTLTPVITLPTIWQSRANVSPSNQTIAVDGISLLSRDGQVITYYSDYSYAFRRWVKFTTTDRSPGEIISNAGYLAVKNTGTSAVTGVYNVDYAACSSNQAEVVTVYNANNETYNAFKFTSNGADYYYVLDEVQTDWVNDLSSIGYSLTKHMPSVFVLLPKSPAVSFGGYNTVVEATDIDGNQIPYSDVEDSMTFNNTSVICICFNNYTYGFVNAGDQVTSFFTNSNGYVAWKSSRYYQNDYCKFASFVSYPNNVTIVDVYQKEAPYRCCKAYCCDGQYFVIDRIQKEWVSDLNSIGYQLNEIENVAYLFGKFYLDGASVSYSQSMSIHVDSNDGLLYTCVGAYNSSGTDYKDRVTLNRNDKWISIYMSLSGNSNLNLYSIKYSTQSRMPKVVSPYMAQFGSSAQTISIQPNAISPWLYITYSSSNINKNDYSGFINGVVNLTDSSNNVVARTGLSAVWDNTNGGQGTYSGYNLAIRNDTGSDVSCMYSRVKLCQNNLIDVTVVTVYDSNNVAYNSFKYTTNGTDYYYVLDDIQSDWVTDLSSIGYSLTITMPTVSVSGDFGTNNLLSCTSGSGSGAFVYIAPNTTIQPYIYGTSNRPVYNSNKAYATIYALDDDDNRIPSINVGYVDNGSSNLLVKNLGSSTILYNSSKVAVCSTSSAEIITVYNSSNETFNAFKYTVGGVDYYYVLDNVQTDWVDDLSSIGYSLTIQLPTVFPQQKYYFNSSGSGNYYFDVNQVKNMLTSSGYKMSYQGEEYTYALNVCKDVSGATQIRTGIPVVNNDGFLAIRNDTGSSVNLSYALIGYCASTQATAITVYNSNNNYAYNAFKYTINGTDYYYVLDEIQTAWVTDLSSIGYSLTQSLPTITKESAYSTPSSGSIGIPAGSSGTLYTHSNPTSVLYDSNNSYSVYGYYVSSFNGGSGWTYGNFFEAQADKYGTSLSAKNITDSTISNIELYIYAVCPNNNAEVVIVYNSSNIEYQAFKYTLGGTDYYYVLDGTQTDWVSDLSSIGFSLTKQLPTISENLIGYFINKSTSSISQDETKQIYSSDGTTRVQYDSSLTYGLMNFYYSVESWGYYRIAQSINDSGNLSFKNLGNSVSSCDRVYYKTCSSNQVTVITVYDSRGYSRNSFKYNLDGTDYYYVLDGEQTSWTDDLSNIGYSEILGGVLPEVVLIGDQSYDYWLYTKSSMSGSTTIPSNGTNILYQTSNSFPGYTTYPKATIVYQSVSGTDAGHTDFDAEEVTYGSTNVKVFGCRNISSTSITLARIKMAYCQNSSVAVITVYDTNNVPYNAFKHIMYDTVTGTDYYYVLDGVQTDWTNDLGSINYYLGSTITLYMTSGNKYIDDDFTNNTGISGVPPVYADQATTTLYYWDYSKRIERGWYNQETGKWVASEIQTQADMPETTGADVYIQMPYGESGIFFGKNTSGNSYYTMTTLDNWFRIYDDAITVWVDEDHQDHTVTGTQTYISDVDWDDNVIYKALYLLRVNSVTNPTGASGYTNRLKNVSFENSNGKVAVKLILNTISITIAKIVFYAKKVSE